MECTSELQTIQLSETPDLIECKGIPALKQRDRYDEESINYRKYLAQQEVLRRLEWIKTQALVLFKL